MAEAASAFAQSRKDVFCNCKIEYFPGFQKITVADRPVFKDPAWEAVQKRSAIRAPAKNPNNEPLPRSVHRAKRRVFDIAALNEFDYFVTLTLDAARIERENPQAVARRLKTYLSNQVSRKRLAYVLVPEYHKDRKGIHMHGLMSGPLQLVDSGKKTNNGKTIYNLPEWRYGFSTCIELTGNPQFAAKYLTKYISKDFRKIFGNFYYAGGKIRRRPPTAYTNAPYEQINAPEYEVPEIGVKFKYTGTEGA